MSDFWLDHISTRPDVILYHFPVSLSSQKVRLALAEKGVQFESRIINIGKGHENFKPWYMRLNPRGVVPTLYHKGKIICDSRTIVFYIEKTFVQGPLLVPHDKFEKQHMDYWIKKQEELPIRELTFSRIPGFSGKFIKEDFEDRRQRLKDYSQRNPDLAQLYQQKLRDAERCSQDIHFEDLSLIYHSIHTTLDDLNLSLSQRKWIAGSSYSLADVCWTVILARFDMLGLRETLIDPRHYLSRYYAQVCRRPSFITADIFNQPRNEVIVPVKTQHSSLDIMKYAWFGVGLAVAAWACTKVAEIRM